MAQYLSHANVDLIISGHRVTGFADEDEPVGFPRRRRPHRGGGGC